jgi:hypothetical protein
MDGNGNIQINTGKNKLLEYRVIVKLNSLKSNYNLMIDIAKTLGRRS